MSGKCALPYNLFITVLHIATWKYVLLHFFTRGFVGTSCNVKMCIDCCITCLTVLEFLSEHPVT